MLNLYSGSRNVSRRFKINETAIPSMYENTFDKITSQPSARVKNANAMKSANVFNTPTNE